MKIWQKIMFLQSKRPMRSPWCYSFKETGDNVVRMSSAHSKLELRKHSLRFAANAYEQTSQEIVGKRDVILLGQELSTIRIREDLRFEPRSGQPKSLKKIFCTTSRICKQWWNVGKTSPKESRWQVAVRRWTKKAFIQTNTAKTSSTFIMYLSFSKFGHVIFVLKQHITLT